MLRNEEMVKRTKNALNVFFFDLLFLTSRFIKQEFRKYFCAAEALKNIINFQLFHTLAFWNDSQLISILLI